MIQTSSTLSLILHVTRDLLSDMEICFHQFWFTNILFIACKKQNTIKTKNFYVLLKFMQEENNFAIATQKL